MASTTMATTIATLKLNPKCLTNKNSTKPSKQIQLITFQDTPKSLAAFAPIAGTAVGAAVFSALSAAEPAFAAQQLAVIAEGDSRGLALLLPIVPAVLWVAYNILQPALNQINRMRTTKGVVAGVGLGGLVGSGFFGPHEASASSMPSDIASLAESTAAASDNRGQLLLFVVAPAIVWVLYNILQPALNQINRMRSQ